jgi:hypothetical protein
MVVRVLPCLYARIFSKSKPPRKYGRCAPGDSRRCMIVYLDLVRRGARHQAEAAEVDVPLLAGDDLVADRLPRRPQLRQVHEPRPELTRAATVALVGSGRPAADDARVKLRGGGRRAA